jgi:hypothetical protein
MQMLIRPFLAISGLLVNSICFAADDYKCSISGAFQVNAAGVQVAHVLKNFTGRQFTVERSSGVMTGSLKNMYVTKPVVIDRGSKENSFKVITTMKNDITSNIYTLTIDEWVEGKRKPFVFLNNSDVYYGSCVHF